MPLLIPHSMNTCSVCEKPIPAGATECSIRCVQQASSKTMVRANKARSSFNDAIHKMLRDETERVIGEQSEVPMITIKHRWMRNRNVVTGGMYPVTVSFDDNGVARIKDIANQRVAVADYVRHSKGLVTFVEDEKVEELAAPAVEAPAKAAAPEDQSVSAPVVEEKVSDTVKAGVEFSDKWIDEDSSVFANSDSKKKPVSSKSRRKKKTD